MKDAVFYAITAVMAFTGVLVPAWIAQEVIHPRLIVLSLFSVAALIYLGVSIKLRMPGRPSTHAKTI